MVTELFWTHILSMNRGSLRTKSLVIYTSPFLVTDERKMDFRAQNVSGAFEKWAP